MNAFSRFWLGFLIFSILTMWTALPSAAQSASNGYSYVWDTQPPDDYLTLRTDPSGSRGQKIMEMPNGTLLEVLEKRADGWWNVRVVSNGAVGWALNRSGSRVWIYCCRSSDGTATAQSDWVEYYYDAGLNEHFFYSPSSVVRTGNTVRVKFYSSKPIEGSTVVNLFEFDCSLRTLRVLSFARYDFRTGNFQSNHDGDGAASGFDTNSPMGFTMRRVCN